MDNDRKSILNYLREKRGIDFSGYRDSMLERRIGQRLTATQCVAYGDYLHYLQSREEELDSLVDVLTINVSMFFRDSLTFAYLNKKILIELIQQKKQANDPSLRIWSAGCSKGEESYSAAIMIHELMETEGVEMEVNIFATDIDANALKKARAGLYSYESVRNVKYGSLNKYFIPCGDGFQLVPEIRRLVTFSPYNLLDQRSYAPPESIFGNFDIVFCRNVLIYFNAEHQALIFSKLYRSLAPKGCLVLGEAEAPSLAYQKHLKRVNDCCHMYQRR